MIEHLSMGVRAIRRHGRGHGDSGLRTDCGARHDAAFVHDLEGERTTAFADEAA